MRNYYLSKTLNLTGLRFSIKQIVLIAVLVTIAVVINNYIAYHSFYYPHAHVIQKSNYLTILITILCLCSGRLLGTALFLVYNFFLLSWGIVAAYCGRIEYNNILAIGSVDSSLIYSMLKESWGLVLLVFLLVGILANISWICSRLRILPAVLCLILTTNNLYRTITYVQDWVPRWLATQQNPDGYGLVFWGHLPGPIGLTTYFYILRNYVPNKETKAHNVVDKVVEKAIDPTVRNIILVIGESALSTHLGLYGYPVATTPYALSLYKSGLLCQVEHTHSSGNMTNTTVPMIVSFKTPDHPERLDTEQNIIEMANSQNWNTYWLDEPGGAGPYGKDYAFIAKYAHHLIKNGTRDHRYHITGAEDLELVDVLSKVVTTPNNNFIILHLAGSHGPYAIRYDSKDRLDLPNASDYDLSIHHTDSFLNQIINVAKHKFGNNYLLIYLSDHGEDLHRKLHGLTNGSIDQYKIPLFLISGERRPDFGILCNHLNDLRSSNGEFPQTSIKYFLLELLGFKLNQGLIKKILTTDHVLHSNNQIYAWPHVPTEKNNPSPLKANPELP